MGVAEQLSARDEQNELLFRPDGSGSESLLGSGEFKISPTEHPKYVKATLDLDQTLTTHEQQGVHKRKNPRARQEVWQVECANMKVPMKAMMLVQDGIDLVNAQIEKGEVPIIRLAGDEIAIMLPGGRMFVIDFTNMRAGNLFGLREEVDAFLAGIIGVRDEVFHTKAFDDPIDALPLFIQQVKSLADELFRKDNSRVIEAMEYSGSRSFMRTMEADLIADYKLDDERDNDGVVLEMGLISQMLESGKSEDVVLEKVFNVLITDLETKISVEGELGTHFEGIPFEDLPSHVRLGALQRTLAEMLMKKGKIPIEMMELMGAAGVLLQLPDNWNSHDFLHAEEEGGDLIARWKRGELDKNGAVIRPFNPHSVGSAPEKNTDVIKFNERIPKHEQLLSEIKEAHDRLRDLQRITTPTPEQEGEGIALVSLLDNLTQQELEMRARDAVAGVLRLNQCPDYTFEQVFGIAEEVEYDVYVIEARHYSCDNNAGGHDFGNDTFDQGVEKPAREFLEKDLGADVFLRTAGGDIVVPVIAGEKDYCEAIAEAGQKAREALIGELPLVVRLRKLLEAGRKKALDHGLPEERAKFEADGLAWFTESPERVRVIRKKITAKPTDPLKMLGGL